MKITQKLAFAATATLGALAFAGAALAADLPARPYTKALLSPAPVFSWTGFYVGGQIGAGWGTSQTNVDVGNTFIGAPVNQTVNQLIAGNLNLNVPLPQVQMNGFLGGAQAGYNYQSGVMVFGVEGDIIGAGLKGTTVCFLVLNCTNKIDWIADITGRVGVTVGDRALVYIKGGAAWAGASVGINQSASLATGAAFAPGIVATGSIAGSASHTVFGGTLGAGVEYAFMPGWSAKIEYDYYDFGSQSMNVPITASGGVTGIGAGSILIRTPVSVTEQVHTVRAGVNYHFN